MNTVVTKRNLPLFIELTEKYRFLLKTALVKVSRLPRTVVDKRKLALFIEI